MLVHRISDKERVVFTGNRQTDFRTVIGRLEYSDPSGSLSSSVSVDYGSLFILKGAPKSMISTRLESGGIVTHIVDDAASFECNAEEGIDSFIRNISTFGSECRIRIGGTSFDGEFGRHSDNSIVAAGGETISVGSRATERDMATIHNFIHRMKMDNGHMLVPMVAKFFRLVGIMRSSDRNRITGYANLLNYLKFIRNPSRKILLSMAAFHSSDYFIDMDSDSSTVTLRVSEIVDGRIVVDMSFPGKMRESSESKLRMEPYVIMTLKPIKLKNQKFPFFVVKHRKIPIFITPLFFNSVETLKSLKGGVNLLS